MKYGKLLPTTIVGSYAQPDWLIDRENLKSRLPPRVRAREIWRIPAENLKQAQDDATVLAIHDQELAGIDIVGDGEMRRESYSNRVANALNGVDIDNPGTAMDRTGQPNPVPRITGDISRAHQIEVDDMAFVRKQTDHMVKITLPGPFTMTQQAQNDHYPDARSMALAYADALNVEIRELFAAGADIVQIDEPYMQARPELAREYGVEAIDRAFEGVDGIAALHICFGYAHVHDGAAKPNGYSFLAELDEAKIDLISIEAAQPKLDLAVLKDLPNKDIMLGVLDLDDLNVETPEIVAGRIRAAFDYMAPERIVVAPDCGMKYLPRDVAFAKLKAMVDGAAIVRAELS